MNAEGERLYCLATVAGKYSLLYFMKKILTFVCYFLLTFLYSIGILLLTVILAYKEPNGDFFTAFLILGTGSVLYLIFFFFGILFGLKKYSVKKSTLIPLLTAEALIGIYAGWTVLSFFLH